MKKENQQQEEFFWTLESGKLTIKEMGEYEEEYGYRPSICNGKKEYDKYQEQICLIFE